MKITKNLLYIITIALLISCDNNDDTVTPTSIPTDGFTYNTTFFETENAYVNIDDDDDNADGFPDSYTFFFTDGRMFDNDANVNGSSGDYLYSTNTTKLVFLNVLVSDNPSLASSFPLPGATYIVSSIEDSVIIHEAQIDPLSPSYINNSVEFGMGNDNIGTFHTAGVVAPTITLNQVNIDNNDPTNSSIDADYSFMNQDGVIITGHYTGTFGVILD
ncbi:hypothetical protein [Maribacter sp.]|uniref:hypothetical protein n=1 Tax=Maribacter sp. TaxID=1897614 RepID=UPI0025B867B1|nr:hypothetical protein [Maribacter sp.]